LVIKSCIVNYAQKRITNWCQYLFIIHCINCRQIRGDLVGISAEMSLVLLFEILANFISMLKCIS